MAGVRFSDVAEGRCAHEGWGRGKELCFFSGGEKWADMVGTGRVGGGLGVDVWKESWQGGVREACVAKVSCGSEVVAVRKGVVHRGRGEPAAGFCAARTETLTIPGRAVGLFTESTTSRFV